MNINNGNGIPNYGFPPAFQGFVPTPHGLVPVNLAYVPYNGGYYPVSAGYLPATAGFTANLPLFQSNVQMQEPPEEQQPVFSSCPLSAYQINKIRKKAYQLQPQHISEIYNLAKLLNTNFKENPLNRTLITHKSGVSFDESLNDYHYNHLREFKIFLIVDRSSNRVKALISDRLKKSDGTPSSGVHGSKMVCTRAHKLVIDLEAESATMTDAARYRINPLITDPRKRQIIINNKRKEYDLFSVFDNINYKGIGKFENLIEYQGTHNKLKTDKLAIFGTYYRNGDLFELNNNLPTRKPESSEKTKVKLKEIFIGLAGITELLHNRGVIHNDIKLENILLNTMNACHLCDFEFAEMVDKVKQDVAYGRTAEYLSPERLEKTLKAGDTKDAISHASDMWAMGVVFYELFTGMEPLWLQLMEMIHRFYRLNNVNALIVDELREIQAAAEYEYDSSKYDAIEQAVLETECVKLMRNYERFTRQFSMGSSFPELMPLPVLRTTLHPPEYTSKMMEELDHLIKSNIQVQNLVGRYIETGALPREHFAKMIDQLGKIHRVANVYIETVHKLLIQGWAVWSRLPVSDDPVVRIIQMMLVVDPAKRIKPDELVNALKAL